MNCTSITPSDLVGKTFTAFEVSPLKQEPGFLVFHTADGKRYEFLPDEAQRSEVWIEDVEGNFYDIIGSPVLRCEHKQGTCHEVDEWHFYTISTIKGSVDIRWFGESLNGYSCEVSLWEVVD